MHHDQAETWFLARLKPNCAAIAERNLRRQGFATFLPMEKQTRARGGRFVTSSRPLFPGYVFVAFDAARGLWRAVNSTHGIAGLVAFGAAPAPVPAGLVSDLMRRCDGSGNLVPERPLGPGDRVRLTTGPFADLLGRIEKMAPDRRVWVLIGMLGGNARLEVGEEQLRAV